MDGSPSMPSMNQPPRPSRVKPPATRSGSPLARYAVRSASRRIAEIDCGAAELDVAVGNRSRPAAGSRSARCTARPTGRPSASHCRRASATEAGLPRSAPSRYSIESQPMTTQSALSVGIEAVGDLLGLGGWPARWRRRPGVASGPSAAMTASSSTPETTTTGSIPAWRNTFRLPGEADASTTRVIGACASAPAASPAAN